MTLKDDLQTSVEEIFEGQWTTRAGSTVPDSDDVKLTNDAVLLDATVLYADLSGSTRMVDQHKPHFSAEVYKAYLYCAARIIRGEKGEVTAYDGDRVMGVFIGATKNTTAVRAALKINWAVKRIVNPAVESQYPTHAFKVKHVVGIDTAQLWVARTGVRGANDLVWVGRAANYAAKLTELDASFPTRITHRVFDRLHQSVKIIGGKEIWEPRLWTPMNNLSIYRSSALWTL